MLLVIGAALVAFLYVRYSPLASSGASATSTPEALQALQAAAQLKASIEQRNANTINVYGD